MRDVINRLLLTLAGAAVLTGTGAAASVQDSHEEMRSRVLMSVSQAAVVTPAAIRKALAEDPGFGDLLEFYREKALSAVGSHREAQDAVQETLIKVWKGRPSLFLETHDDVVRYLYTATKRNLVTAIQKSAGTARTRVVTGAEAADQMPARSDDPADTVASGDLLETLAARLSPGDADVLAAYLDGQKSQRSIARHLGLTRYAVSEATTRIGQELRTLLDEAA